jgi:hypothetical protein
MRCTTTWLAHIEIGTPSEKDRSPLPSLLQTTTIDSTAPWGAPRCVGDREELRRYEMHAPRNRSEAGKRARRETEQGIARLIASGVDVREEWEKLILSLHLGQG